MFRRAKQSFHLLLEILTVQGSKRQRCTDNDPPPAEIFFDDHYGEIGFPRDVCVELGRNLHQRLRLTRETKPCAKLADTRTSTCWPCQDCRKWKREDRKNAKANSKVMNRALAMVQHFITVVAKDNKLVDIPDQIFIFECIETAVDRLTKSGLNLYSKTDEQKVKLINEIEQLKPAFCGGYLRQLASEAEKRRADYEYLAELYKKEIIEANTHGEAEGNLEDSQADYVEGYKMKGLQEISNLNGKTDNEESESDEMLHPDIEIEGPTSPMKEIDKKQLASEAEKGQAENLAELSKNEFLEAQANSQGETEGYPEDPQADYAEGYKMKGLPEASNLDGNTDNEESELDEMLHRGIGGRIRRLKEIDKKQIGSDLRGTLTNTITKWVKFDETKLDTGMKKTDTAGSADGTINQETTADGNTALHLAVMLGKRIFVRTLLNYGASIRTRNLLGWSPMDEAVSYGDEGTITLLLLKLPSQTQDELIQKRQTLLKELITVPDFYMELKWEFRFKVSPVNYLLPSDLCKLRKRDKSIRMDWSLVGMTDNMRYKYGHVALLFDGLASPPLVYFLQVKKKKFMKIEIENQEEISEFEAGYRARKSMKNNIVSATMSTRNTVYTQVKGWWSSFKTEDIGPFKASIYTVNGLALKFRERTEHRPKKEEEKKEGEPGLQKSKTGEAGEDKDKKKKKDKDEKKKKNKDKKKKEDRDEKKEENNNGDNEDKDNAEKKKERKEEEPLPPPPPTDVTWEEYIDAEPGEYRSLAREIDAKEKTIKVKESTLAMVPRFPITKESFVRILEVVAPFKQFNKLREFVEMKLPPGFPVRLDIPIMMGVSARITILKIESSETIAEEEILDKDLFTLPEGYKEMGLDDEDKLQTS